MLQFLAPLTKDGYKAISISDEMDSLTEYMEDDIPASMNDLPNIERHQEKKSIIHTTVRIRKATYEGHSQWVLVYRQALNVSIDDDEWLDQFQSGKVQAPPGSTLEVDLEESFMINDNDEIASEATYRVIKVNKVNLPPTQLKIDGF